MRGAGAGRWSEGLCPAQASANNRREKLKEAANSSHGSAPLRQGSGRRPEMRRAGQGTARQGWAGLGWAGCVAGSGQGSPRPSLEGLQRLSQGRARSLPCLPLEWLQRAVRPSPARPRLPCGTGTGTRAQGRGDRDTGTGTRSRGCQALSAAVPPLLSLTALRHPGRGKPCCWQVNHQLVLL